LSEPADGRVGVGKRLKIGQELFGPVAPGKGFLALQQLIGYGQSSAVGAGSGPTGIAKDAPAAGDLTVPVGTGKTGINRYFLNPASKKGTQIGVQVVIAFVHSRLPELD